MRHGTQLKCVQGYWFLSFCQTAAKNNREFVKFTEVMSRETLRWPDVLQILNLGLR